MQKARSQAVADTHEAVSVPRRADVSSSLSPNDTVHGAPRGHVHMRRRFT